MRKVLSLTTALVVGAATPVFAESWHPDDHHFMETSVSEAGGRITYNEAGSATVYGSPYSFNNRYTFNRAGVHVTYVGTDGMFKSTYKIIVVCNSGNCINFNNTGTDTASLKFANLAEAQQWAERIRSSGGGANAAASCQQDPSVRYGAQLANTVTLTVGGAADGHFYTADGIVNVVHRGYHDANGMTSGFQTYLEGDNGQVYRLGPGKWQIQPGCYTHRTANASVLGTGSLTSTVLFTNKTAARNGPALSNAELEAKSACHSWALRQLEPASALDQCMKSPSGYARYKQQAQTWADCNTWAGKQPGSFRSALDRCMKARASPHG
jgi:hypothetical protein